MYKIIKGNLTTFVETLNESPECDIISFTCSNDGSLLVALVKFTKASIEKEAIMKEAKIKADEAAKAQAIKEEREAKKAELKAALEAIEEEKKAEKLEV